MFNNNRNNTIEFIMTDYLSLVRQQNNILNNIITSMSSVNSNTVNVINSYAELRRHRDIFSDHTTSTSTTTSTTTPNITPNTTPNTTTRTNRPDISNNFILPRSSRLRRHRYNPPPPPPPPSSSNTQQRSQVRFYNNSRNRRAGRTTFYTPFFPTNSTNPRNTITSFINNTLWDATSNTNLPASIQCIINNTKIYKWVDIKNDNPNTERCPIDLSLLTDDDIVVQLNHCKHIFKYKNIFRWFAINSKCPVCRHNIIYDSSNNTISDNSNNISLNVTDLSLNSTDISLNDIDINNDNDLDLIRRRVENLLNLDSSSNLITADITFSIEPTP